MIDLGCSTNPATKGTTLKTPAAKAVIKDNNLESILLTQVRPHDRVTLVHTSGNITTKRVSDFLPSIDFWFENGWYGPFRGPTPRAKLAVKHEHER
jgi:hypothetical protein